jgi:hypothetical protein
VTNAVRGHGGEGPDGEEPGQFVFVADQTFVVVVREDAGIDGGVGAGDEGDCQAGCTLCSVLRKGFEGRVVPFSRAS